MNLINKLINNMNDYFDVYIGEFEDRNYAISLRPSPPWFLLTDLLYMLFRYIFYYAILLFKKISRRK